MPGFSWMVEHLDWETRHHHVAADLDRVQLLRPNATRADYVDYLVRLYGFEAPVELAVATVAELAGVLRYRRRAPMLAADLLALGQATPRIRTAPRPTLRSAADALGWLYVVERGRQLHGVLHRHLSLRIPHEIYVAGSYLASQANATGARWCELGEALDRVAHAAPLADRIVRCAQVAFRRQRAWFEHAHPSREAA